MRKNIMKKKRNNHRQHRDIGLNNQLGLRVGGIVVPYWPSYWGGIGGGSAHHGQTTTEGAQNDNSGTPDASAGADSSGQM
jgi:hypothetical protein